MSKMEVFFDYVCHFCLKGHENLKSLRARYPNIHIVWRPCEAHPRADGGHGPHSELCIEGFFFAQAKGIDIEAYHERMFKAAHVERVDLESVDEMVRAVKGLVDEQAFRASLEKREYAQAREAANDYAYEQSGVWTIPAYRMDGRKLDSAAGIGVTTDQLAAFMDSAKPE